MKKAMTISYEIGTKLYMNLTNKCPCSCTFCIRNNGDGAYGSDSLWLEHDPSFEEITKNLSDKNITSYEEIVFCGFGEPTSRIETLIKSADYLKKIKNCPPLRLNTNGLSDLINGRDTSAELCKAFDVISVSLNAGTRDEYMKVTRPIYDNAFEAMQEFTSKCVQEGTARIIMSVVDVIPEEELQASRELSERLGATLRIRKYDA